MLRLRRRLTGTKYISKLLHNFWVSTCNTPSLFFYMYVSAFKQFHQLYREYQQSTNDTTLEMVDHNGYINTEVFMPIDVISEKLPALRVSCCCV